MRLGADSTFRIVVLCGAVRCGAVLLNGAVRYLTHRTVKNSRNVKSLDVSGQAQLLVRGRVCCTRNFSMRNGVLKFRAEAEPKFLNSQFLRK